MSTRITKFLDLLEKVQDPVFFMRLRAYVDRWEDENTGDSSQILAVYDRFMKLMEIVENCP